MRRSDAGDTPRVWPSSSALASGGSTCTTEVTVTILAFLSSGLLLARFITRIEKVEVLKKPANGPWKEAGGMGTPGSSQTLRARFALISF